MMRMPRAPRARPRVQSVCGCLSDTAVSLGSRTAAHCASDLQVNAFWRMGGAWPSPAVARPSLRGLGACTARAVPKVRSCSPPRLQVAASMKGASLTRVGSCELSSRNHAGRGARIVHTLKLFKLCTCARPQPSSARYMYLRPGRALLPAQYADDWAMWACRLRGASRSKRVW